MKFAPSIGESGVWTAPPFLIRQGFCGLRWGEPASLLRQDLDTDTGLVRGRRVVSELNNGRRVAKAPKSEAGKRTVAVPGSLVPVIRTHMEPYAEPGAQGRVFEGPKGATPRRNHVNRLWHKACAQAGI